LRKKETFKPVDEAKTLKEVIDISQAIYDIQVRTPKEENGLP